MPQIESARPQELLTQANAILGNGQLSLAKYLMIVEDRDTKLDIHDIAAFFRHCLARFDPRRDLHFQTESTIDTLDYSGSGFNQGSKLVIAARDIVLRELGSSLPSGFTLPEGFGDPRLILPGVLAITAPRFVGEESRADLKRFRDSYSDRSEGSFPLITLVDDSDFAAKTLNNWLWITFTRSNPAVDVDGIDSAIVNKHWGCRGAVVIDARIKPHHAPPVVEDHRVVAQVDARAARGGPIARYL